MPIGLNTRGRANSICEGSRSPHYGAVDAWLDSRCRSSKAVLGGI